MKSERGMALAVSLILLMLLSLLALSGARLGAADLRISLAEEQRLLAFEQAQSAIDGALQRGCVENCGEGLAVTRLATPALPPPVGAGYSADALSTGTLRYEASAGGTALLAENLSVLRAASTPGPSLGADCARRDPEPLHLALDGGRPIAVSARGSEIVAQDDADAAHPVELWRLLPAGDFSLLAPAWSTPRAARVLLDGEPRTVILLGGGYGENRGTALFVLRADTGALVWRGTHPQLQDGIAAGLALLDSDADGAVDRIVAADTGGGLWRADLTGAPAEWKLTLLARLAGRFFAAPGLVQERDARGRYDAVIVGSGDAEHPRASGAGDFLYLVRDRNTAAGSGVDRDGEPEGWRLALPAGEKIFTAPLAIAHTAYYSTFSAGAAATCEAGRNQVQSVRLASGAPRPPGPAFEGLPRPLLYDGPAEGGSECLLRLRAGPIVFEVPGCSRFRGAWARVAS